MTDISKYTALVKSRIKCIPNDAGLYPADDLPPHIEKLMKRREKKPQPARNDLVKGNVVVALEGIFAGKRVVFLKQTENNLALCCGPRSINNVPFFLINERYLLKTSTIIEFDANVDISTENIFISERESKSEFMDVELTKEERKIEEVIVEAVLKVKFMKTYLATNFVAPKYEGMESLHF